MEKLVPNGIRSPDRPARTKEVPAQRQNELLHPKLPDFRKALLLAGPQASPVCLVNGNVHMKMEQWWNEIRETEVKDLDRPEIRSVLRREKPETNREVLLET